MEDRLQKLRRVTRAGLLLAGIGSAVAPIHAGQSLKDLYCQRPDSLTAAQRIALCEPEPARRLEQDLGVPADLAPRLASLAVRNLELHATGLETFSEAKLRALESDLVDLLRENPDFAVAREEVRSFYHHRSLIPSPALLDLVAGSAAPEQLALALVDSEEFAWSPAQNRIFALLLRAHPDQPALWIKSSRLNTSTPWRIACLEEALRRLDSRESDAVLAVRASLLQIEVEAGLGERAVDTWRGMPASQRARLLARSGREIQATIGGHDFKADATGLALNLVAAHLLAGDLRGAAALEAALPAAPTAPAEKWLEPIRNETTRELRLRREFFTRWLRPSPDDPFLLLTGIMSMSERSAPAGSLLLLSRLSEREGYPALARFASEKAVWVWGNPAAAMELPPGLPSRLTDSVRRIEADLAKLHEEVKERAATAERAVPPGVVAAIDNLVDAGGRSSTPAFLLPERKITLFVTDREGRRGFAIWYEGPPRGPKGGQVRLEKSGDTWSGIQVAFWIA
ncbi:MAG TPA: hypothetical protein VLB76_20980 [Thermoanaerobaculia bacterium]|jgi:hypothetical protein|nr:hypothetical protein [Thermoanaerobaculia bacterium]